MKMFDSQVCCRGFAEALGRRAGEGAGAALLIGVGEDGGLFYKVSHTAGGQFTSAFGERVAFCPFCGRGVGAAHAQTRAAAAETNEEVTRWHLGETQEVETVIAALAAHEAATRIHISEF
jgi:hypothetical protein